MNEEKDAVFKVGFVQFCPVRCDVPANILQVERLLAGVQADLLVLPELTNSGYLYASPADLAPYAEPGDGSGPFLSALRGLAEQTGGVIVTGFAEHANAGLYNSAAAVDAGGVRQVYRKTHLFADEKLLFLPGDTGFRVFEHHGARIGMMVCFDWHFPEAARTLALRGSQIIAHPSNLVMPFCQTAMVTRCLENRVFAITCNRYGTEELAGQPLTFTGASQILDTLGRRLVQAPAEGDFVTVYDIDSTLADDKRVNVRNDLFADRRPEMYA
jgi:predicted amidohydrolase